MKTSAPLTTLSLVTAWVFVLYHRLGGLQARLLLATMAFFGAAMMAPNVGAAQAPHAQKREVVFIESNVADVTTLINGVRPGREVHVLDARRDGLAQMAQILRGRRGVSAVHLLSHGSQGALDLGALTLNGDNLQEHAADLAAIGGALNHDAGILLYGCDVAKGAEGAEFVSALAQSTHAKIAASTNLTGTAAKGGDWTLEHATGMLHTAALREVGYQGILGTTATYSFEAGLSSTWSTSITSAPTTGSAAAGETLLVSSSQTILGSLNQITGITWLGSDSLLADYGGNGAAGMDTLTFKLSSNNQFDLTSFQFTDPSGNSSGRTATIKAYVGATNVGTSNSINYSSATGFTASSDTASGTFAGITSFTLTTNVASGAQLAFDTITLANITPPGFTVTYNANNSTAGSVPTDSTNYSSGATVTVASNSGSLARTGYTFAGWNTATNGSGTSYAAGSGTFTINANTTLYAQWVAAPSATTSAASSVAGTTATLNGSVDDKGASTTITFEYGTTSGAGGSYTNLGIAPASNGTLAVGSGATNVSKGLTGLSYGSTYYYRVKAVNSQGTTYGSEQSFTTTKQSQTITFANPGTQTFGTTPTLSASSDSALTVSFSSSTTGVCTVSGTTLTFVTAGSCTINADQAGNSTYAAATTVSRTFTVNAIAPGAPTIGTATAGNTQATVSFTAPGATGGASISSYTVTASPGGATGTGASSPITVTGLTNGTAYTFTVTATNSAGTGSASAASNSVTPAASQTITFANPGAQNFGTTPTLTATATSSLTVSFSSSTTSVCTITTGGALTFLTTGTCTINADQAGNGSFLAATTVTRSFAVNAVAPGAPTIGSASAGDTQATVTFTAPASNGGATITGYTVTSNPGGLTGTGASSPITVTGLTNGTAYTFTVTATNSAGTGSASAASNSVTPQPGPAVNSVTVGSCGTSPNPSCTFKSGATIDLTVNWDAAVTVTGTPRISMVIGATTVYANYLSGSGSTATIFRYTVTSGLSDTNGITIGTLSLNGGSIQSGGGIDATLTLNSVDTTAAVLVDAVAPTLPAANIVVNNQADPHKVILTFSEALSSGTLGSAGNWTVTANGGSPIYSIASVGLSGGNVVTLTLGSVDLTSASTYVTNAAANAHLKVTPPATLTDSAGNTYAAGLVTESGATHVLDGTAPTLSAVSSSSPSSSGGTLTATASEKAKGYWVAVASGATAPTVAQVKAGANYGAVTVVASGNGVLAAATPATLTLSGLSASTAYDIYLMAEDAAGNPVAAVATATLTTTAASAASSGGSGTSTSTTNPFNPAGTTTVGIVTGASGTPSGFTPATTSLVTNLPNLENKVGVSDNGVVVIAQVPKEPVVIRTDAPDNVLFSVPQNQGVQVVVGGNQLGLKTNTETVKDGSGNTVSTVLATKTYTNGDGKTVQSLQVVTGQATTSATSAGQILGGLTLSNGGTLRDVVATSGQIGSTVGYLKNQDTSGSVSAEDGDVTVEVTLSSQGDKANRFADTVKQTLKLKAGEVARFNIKGELLGVYAGSLSGTVGKTGDPLKLVKPTGMARYPTQAAKLDGNVLARLGTNLLPSFAAVAGVSSDDLKQDATTGTVSLNTPPIKNFGLPLLPVKIDPSAPDGVTMEVDGTATWTHSGVSVRFAPALEDPVQFAAGNAAVGLQAQVLDDGTLLVTRGNEMYIARSDFSSRPKSAVPNYSWDYGINRVRFTYASGLSQELHPTLYSATEVNATVQGLGAGWVMNRSNVGPLTISGPKGERFTLLPDYSLGIQNIGSDKTPPTGWRAEDGYVYYLYSTEFVPYIQRFTLQ